MAASPPPPGLTLLLARRRLKITFVPFRCRSSSIAGAALVLAAAFLSYDVRAPDSVPLLVAGFLLSVLVFAAVGFLLGALAPTARAAQGAGIVLFFVMLMLAGAGPPPEVMPGTLEAIGKATPLQHVIVLLQDAWLGLGWNWTQAGIAGGFPAAALALSLWRFRWE